MGQFKSITRVLSIFLLEQSDRRSVGRTDWQAVNQSVVCHNSFWYLFLRTMNEGTRQDIIQSTAAGQQQQQQRLWSFCFPRFLRFVHEAIYECRLAFLGE